MRFTNRVEAGRKLAEKMADLQGAADAVVLALPRGGVPVARALAERLELPFGIYVVRKVGLPGREELAMGAVASGDVVVRNDDVIEAFGVSEEVFNSAADEQLQEVARREQAYRGSRPPPPIRGRTVVLVDDGLATGASMTAAVEAVREHQPRKLVVAVPVAARSTAEVFRGSADRFVCVEVPAALDGVGGWYEDFRQVSDEEVRRLIA